MWVCYQQGARNVLLLPVWQFILALFDIFKIYHLNKMFSKSINTAFWGDFP